MADTFRPVPEWRVYPSPDALAGALADAVAEVLRDAVARRGEAFLAVSGGSTPKLFFSALSKKHLDWTKVTVTLVDERFVPPSSERSNEKMVRERLLVAEAATARFVGLHHPAGSAEAAAALASQQMSGLAWPLDAAILGMGTDGHTASFFPDAPNLPHLLDPALDTLVEAVQTRDGGEPRLTLPIGRLLEAGFLALHIEGEEKRGILEQALEPGSALPIGAVFAQSMEPVPVYWAG